VEADCFKVNPEMYGLPFSLCSTEQLITAWVGNNIAYEDKEIKLILSALDNYPKAQLLDIGSNMGLFSITAAIRNHVVVAVDAMLHNHKVLKKSAVLNNVADNIVLVNNAVSDFYEEYYSGLDFPGNNMGTRMISKSEAERGNVPVYPARREITDEVEIDRNDIITSVTLEDLLDIVEEETVIIKIDIEGFECKAFTNYLNRKKKDKFVPYILMEWELLQDEFNRNYNCPQYSSMIQGFTDSGYQPYGPNLTKIEDLSRLLYHNIFWKHKSAKDVAFLKTLQQQPAFHL